MVTAVMFGLLPFSTFLADNADEASIDFGFLAYPIVLIGAGLIAIGVAYRAGGKVGAERAAVLFAVVTFIFFKFIIAQNVVARLGMRSEYWLPLVLWLGGLAGATIAAVRLSRRASTWSFVLVFGVLLVAVSTYQFAVVAGRKVSDVEGQVPEQVLTSEKRDRPDVWFLLLDGYSRADVVQREVGYDNMPFLRALRGRGFSVSDHAAASYPRTVGSLASTLAMDYVIRPGELNSIAPLWTVLRGRNATVRSFRELGYRIAMATDYAELTCGDNTEMICVYPPEGPGIGSRNTVLDGTPLKKLVRWVQGIGKGGSDRQLLAPDEAVRQVALRAGGSPLFTYVHLITPHPPYRFEDDCSSRPIPDLNRHGWFSRERPLYAVAIRCVNEQLLRAVDLILARDTDAVIVIAGDHGSAFGVPLNKNANTWSPEQVVQRYGLLSALRAPKDCPDASAPAVPANTFRIVLSCVTGQVIPLLPPKRFSMVYGSGTSVEELRQVDLSPR